MSDVQSNRGQTSVEEFTDVEVVPEKDTAFEGLEHFTLRRITGAGQVFVVPPSVLGRGISMDGTRARDVSVIVGFKFNLANLKLYMSWHGLVVTNPSLVMRVDAYNSRDGLLGVYKNKKGENSLEIEPPEGEEINYIVVSPLAPTGVCMIEKLEMTRVPRT